MIIEYKKEKIELCHTIVKHLITMLDNGIVSIAISGGSTPKILFSLMATEYANKIKWRNLKIYWVDERCVSPKDKDSNYKMTYDSMLKEVSIPKENIFRIKGEDKPQEEAKRYNKLVLSNLPNKNEFPVFDLVMLGIGDDGHTSSIFPTEMHLLDSPLPYEVATNPYSGQTRIAMTGRAILKAKEIIFLVTGDSKKKILKNIVNKKHQAEKYPSYFIISNREDCKIFTDIDVNSLSK